LSAAVSQEYSSVVVFCAAFQVALAWGAAQQQQQQQQQT
jgi:hypothetical protein